MGYYELVIGVIAAVILFIYGLQNFSDHIQELGKDRLHDTLGRLTHNRLSGFALGAGFTALVQSSSAVTALAVALVDAGVITFHNSLAVLVGSNVGTTVTAWLVSLKLTGIGPVFIILGAVVALVPGISKVVGKSIFYFGLIFFGLDLISNALEPIKQDDRLLQALAATSNPVLGAITGALMTALVQSSSVVTGLAILLVQQGAIDITGAVSIIIGANVGTTVTGLIASIPMKPAARRTAVANLVLNAVGMVLFLPLAPRLATFAQEIADSPGIAVAIAHLIFNLGVAIIALPLLGPLARWLAPD